MISSRREKILAALAAASVTGALLLEAGLELPLQPFADLDTAISQASSQADEHQIQVNRLLHDLHALEEAVTRSLPADPGRASALYQAWLVQQLNECGIESASVNPSVPLADEFLGHRIPFTIECDASAAAIAGFIDRFSSTPLLHRITSLQIVNSSSGFDDHHRLAVSIEALALPGADAIQTLPQPDSRPDPESSLTALLEQRQLLLLPKPPEPDVTPGTPPLDLAQNPPPQRTEPTPPDPPPTPPEPPRPPAPGYSPGQSLQFIGSTLSNNTRQAWFVDRRSGDDYFAVASQEVAIPELTVKVLAVTDDSVTVLYKSKRIRMRLGQTAALPPAPFQQKKTASENSPVAPSETPQPVTALE
ncbi:MAG: hypothetical protein ACKO2P_17350 [Planctomycetota bacterium]